MSSTTASDGSVSGLHVPDIMAAPDITADAGAVDDAPLPISPTRRRFSADWWRTRFTTAAPDDPLAVQPNADLTTTSADFPTPPPPDFPAVPLPPPPPPRSVPMIRRDGGSSGRTRPFSVPATADFLGTGRTSPEIASPASAPMRMSSRRLFRPHSVDELWGPPAGTSRDAMPAFQHRLRRHQSGHLRDRFMANQTVGSGGSDVVGGGGSVPSAFAPAIPLQRFHTHTQPIDLPFDRTETMDTNDFRSSWFFGSGGRRRRDDADREGDEGDDDHDDADEEAEDETDAHVGASTSDSEGAGLHRSRVPLAGSTNAGPNRRPSLLRMRHEQRRMRREEHDRSTMSDLGLSADFQDHVTKYRRTWRANWPTRRTSAMNTASLQSINPARYVYERRHRKTRQSHLEGFGGHLWSALTVGRYFGRLRESKPLRAFFILLHLATDLALVVLYLFEMAALFPTLDTQVPMPGFHPPWLWIPRPFPIYVVGLFLAMINLVAFVSRLAFTDDLVRTLVSWDTPVDLLTSVPFFVSIFLHNGPLLYIPYFLRSIPCISRLRRFLHIRLELSDTIEAVDALREKLTALVATIVGIIYVTMCAFQYTEVMFGNQTLSIIDSVYVTVVTLTTVGYGDVTPKSWQGKLVVVVGILVSFVFVPGLVSSAVETWKIRRDGGGTFFKRKRLQHVVLIGRFEDPRLVSSLLQALFHS
ncbi:potassium channel, sub T, member 2, partial [Allomyces arbusculus]